MKSLAIDLNSVDSFVNLLTMVQNAKEGKFVPWSMNVCLKIYIFIFLSLSVANCIIINNSLIVHRILNGLWLVLEYAWGGCILCIILHWLLKYAVCWGTDAETISVIPLG